MLELADVQLQTYTKRVLVQLKVIVKENGDVANMTKDLINGREVVSPSAVDYLRNEFTGVRQLYCVDSKQKVQFADKIVEDAARSVAAEDVAAKSSFTS